MLQPLSVCQKLGINDIAPDRLLDLPYRLACTIVLCSRSCSEISVSKRWLASCMRFDIGDTEALST